MQNLVVNSRLQTDTGCLSEVFIGVFFLHFLNDYIISVIFFFLILKPERIAQKLYFLSNKWKKNARCSKIIQIKLIYAN